MKWLVSGDANEKQPVPAILPFFPPGTPGTVKEHGRRFTNVWRSWRRPGAPGENPVYACRNQAIFHESRSMTAGTVRHE
jgi:hypothetical protein